MSKDSLPDGPLPGTIEVTDEIFVRPSDAKPGYFVLQVTEEAVVFLSPAKSFPSLSLVN